MVPVNRCYSNSIQALKFSIGLVKICILSKEIQRAYQSVLESEYTNFTFIRTFGEKHNIGTKKLIYNFEFFSGKFGLWLDGDLNQGRSQRCSTYANEPLAPEEDFVIKTLECWAFV